jgi:hypothetical protein
MLWYNEFKLCKYYEGAARSEVEEDGASPIFVSLLRSEVINGTPFDVEFW